MIQAKSSFPRKWTFALPDSSSHAHDGIGDSSHDGEEEPGYSEAAVDENIRVLFLSDDRMAKVVAWNGGLFLEVSPGAKPKVRACEEKLRDEVDGEKEDKQADAGASANV